MPTASEYLKLLQDEFDRKKEEDKQRKKDFVPAPEIQCPKNIRISPTSTDILLMDEYERGIYQGD